MKLLEAYSLAAGQRIGNPFVLEKFYSLPFDRYITFQPFSKEAKTYSYYIEVLKLIFPVLEKAGIKIVQLGQGGEPPFDFCYHTQGKTNIGNLAYLVKGAMLHLGADSIASHLAGYYNIPLVTLYAANYTECVVPYFGDKQKQIFIEADRGGKKPSFAFQENPKTIDTIKPEDVANNVLKMLGLELEYPYKTIIIHPLYNARTVEIIPNNSVDLHAVGVDTVTVRMDLLFDERCLIEQTNRTNVVVITNGPISPSYFKNYRHRIKEVYYEITETPCIPFPHDVVSNGIKLNMFSFLPEEKLNPIKFHFMDFGVIWRKSKQNQQDYNTLKDIPVKNLFYKSNKFVLSNKKIYQSIADAKADQPIPSLSPVEQPVIDNTYFWREAEFYYFLSK